MAERSSYATSNGLSPKGGPRAIMIPIDFVAANPTYIDLEREVTRDVLEFVQGMYVDNFSNPSPIEITFAVTQQRILIPGWSGGYIAVLSAKTCQFSVSQRTLLGETTSTVNIELLNFPVANCIWNRASGIDVTLSATIAATATVSSAVNLYSNTLCGVQLPATFTGVALSFQTSTSLTGTYVQMQKNGVAHSVVVAQNTYVILDPKDFAGIQFIKFVSGTAEGALRTLTPYVRPL